MITRGQEIRISDLAMGIEPDGEPCEPGPVHVSEGFTDGSIYATIKSHKEFKFDQDGGLLRTAFNHSVKWSVLDEA